MELHCFIPKDGVVARQYKKITVRFQSQKHAFSVATLASLYLDRYDYWRRHGVVGEEIRVLVLINPASGERVAHQVWLEQGEFVFQLDPRFHMEVVLTTHAGHAMEVGETVERGKYHAILTVSGDGLFHELLNGIAKRPDFDEFRNQICLGIIPGGSGNGLNVTMGIQDPTTAAFAIAKGFRTKIDLAKTTQAGQVRVTRQTSLSFDCSLM